MSDEGAFHRAILDYPEDDGPRLVYADWLDERGDPRGEFIRVQCELATLPAQLKKGDRIDERDFHAVQVSALGRWSARDWTEARDIRDEAERKYTLAVDGFPNPALAPLRVRETELLKISDEGRRWLGLEAVVIGGRLGFRRGFCESIADINWSNWRPLAAALLAHNPVREVWLSTRPKIVSQGTNFWLDDDGPTDRVVAAADERYLASACVRQVLNKRWPGITFHVPREEVRPDPALAEMAERQRRYLSKEEFDWLARQFGLPANLVDQAGGYPQTTTGAWGDQPGDITRQLLAMRELLRDGYTEPADQLRRRLRLPRSLDEAILRPTNPTTGRRYTAQEYQRFFQNEWLPQEPSFVRPEADR